MTDLLLASASPRRAALLRSAGLTVELRPPNIDESRKRDEPAVAHARRLAQAKLREVRPDGDTLVPLLAADTVVWNESTAAPLGKPRDRDHARATLGALFGADHFVTTAWALEQPGRPPRLAHHTTRVWMRPVGEAELEAYLDTDEWTDKAGGYGIQGHAAGFVTRIEGSYTNVVGLPLAQVLSALRVPPP